MKYIISQISLILLFFLVILITTCFILISIKMFTSTSYMFVTFFVLLILSSNILSKIALKYVNLKDI